MLKGQAEESLGNGATPGGLQGTMDADDGEWEVAAKSHNAARRKKRKQARRAARAAAAQQAAQARHGTGAQHHLEGAADGGDSDDWETDGAVLSRFPTSSVSAAEELHAFPRLAQHQKLTCEFPLQASTRRKTRHLMITRQLLVHMKVSLHSSFPMHGPCKAIYVPAVCHLCADMLWLNLKISARGWDVSTAGYRWRRQKLRGEK